MVESPSGRLCEVHRRHVPQPRVVHRHHIWPQADGGPDDGWNLVTVCPTGHDNIHAYLRLLDTHGGKVPRRLRWRFTPVERQVAEAGRRLRNEAV